MAFSDRIDRITPSATLEMTEKAAELRSRGYDVINMSVGEPDFETPKNIVSAAVEAMSLGHTRYTPGSGTKHCKEAIQSKVLRDNNINAEVFLNTKKNLGKQLDLANKRQLTVAVICGENEFNDNTVTIKNLKGVKGENNLTIPKADLINEIKKLI